MARYKKPFRAKCPECGKAMGVAAPKGGDGSVEVYPRHKNKDGARCRGGRDTVDPENYVD